MLMALIFNLKVASRIAWHVASRNFSILTTWKNCQLCSNLVNLIGSQLDFTFFVLEQNLLRPLKGKDWEKLGSGHDSFGPQELRTTDNVFRPHLSMPLSKGSASSRAILLLKGAAKEG
jgi:hypothetical protein